MSAFTFNHLRISHGLNSSLIANFTLSFQGDFRAVPLSLGVQYQSVLSFQTALLPRYTNQDTWVALKHLIAKSANITAPFFLICLSKGFSSREVDIGRSHIQPPASALAGPSQPNWHNPHLNGSHLVASISYLTASTETTHNQLQPTMLPLPCRASCSPCLPYFIVLILLFS